MWNPVPDQTCLVSFALSARPDLSRFFCSLRHLKALIQIYISTMCEIIPTVSNTGLCNMYTNHTKWVKYAMEMQRPGWRVSEGTGDIKPWRSGAGAAIVADNIRPQLSALHTSTPATGGDSNQWWNLKFKAFFSFNLVCLYLPKRTAIAQSLK